MKVGILTHYNVNNQGAQLQMYALQEYLKEIQNDVFILTYNKNFDFVDENIKRKNIVTIKSIPYFLKEFLLKKGVKLTLFNYKKYKINKNFRKNNFKYKNYSNADVDCAFIGSDEVFSIEVGYNPMMYGHAVNSKRIVSYAPSFGQTNEKMLKEYNVLELVSSGLKKFDYLSARDSNTLNIIKNITGRTDIEEVCDPVLLYDFKNITPKIKKIKKPYLIVYGYDKNFTDINEINSIKKYAKEKGLITVSVGTYHKWCDKNINCNCLEWIEYFRNSNEIITDTFHGTILSIITNKPVAIMIRNIINSNKLSDLTKRLGISNRVIKTISYNELNSVFSTKMDYKKINCLVEDLRKKSKKYIEKCLDYSNVNNIMELPKKCTGCGSCSKICPKDAISLSLNKYGFYEAKVDNNKCIKCGLCKKVCPRNSNNATDLKQGILYAAYSKDDAILANSTSGGIAYEIAKYGIEHGYWVSGVVFDCNSKKAKTILTNNLEDIDKFSGSKYIQSYTEDFFDKYVDILKEDKNSKFIIFGTPCQIAGIKQFNAIKGIKNDILLIDIFCHGVPSYNVFNKYINEQKIDKINSINFRSKKNGWHNYVMQIKNGNNNIFIKSERSNFYKAFFDNRLLNFSCNECLLNKQSYSDIRIGDFWGKNFSSNNTGVSSIIINSGKGRELFNNISNHIYYKKIENVNECLAFQRKNNINDNEIKDAHEYLLSHSLGNTISYYRKKMSNKYLFVERIKFIISYLPVSVKNLLRRFLG